jgi:hypothetical protein
VTEIAPTAFAGLNGVLQELVARSQALLDANFVGAYLQGSFALGAGDAYSDADFIIVTREDITDDACPALDAMHGAVYDLPDEWARHIEGSYVPEWVLRTAPPTPHPLLFLNNGARTLIRDEHDNTNVVRWVLRQRGIVLRGPHPRDLIDEVTPDVLRAEVRRSMRTFGDELLQGRITIDALWLQGFTVLHYCRVLQTIATGEVTSKPAAVRWASSHLDPRWSVLIASAWEQRSRWPRGRGAPERHDALRPDPAEVSETLDFVRYALELAGESPGR